jgi:hypothetical protein
MATTKSARQEPTEALVDKEETFTPESAEDGDRFAHLQLPEDELRGDDDDEDDEDDEEDHEEASEDPEEDSEDDEEDEVQVENEQ